MLAWTRGAQKGKVWAKMGLFLLDRRGLAPAEGLTIPFVAGSENLMGAGRLPGAVRMLVACSLDLLVAVRLLGAVRLLAVCSQNLLVAGRLRGAVRMLVAWS